MADINELTAKLKAAAQDEIMCREAYDTSDAWHDAASPENVMALTEALEAAQSSIAELEARTVKLPKRSVGEVMHISGFSRDYAEGWCSGNDNARHEIAAAGIKLQIEGE